MRRLDRYAIEKIGIPEAVLMESAGRSVFAEIRRREGDVAGKRVAVFCGSGNNGGDGFVIARYLHLSGAQVDLFLVEKTPKKEAALRNLRVLEKMELRPQRIKTQRDLPINNARWECVVDALFGVGLTRSVKGIHAQTIEFMNAIGCPIYAVDLPSGLHTDSGEILGMAVQASVTVTFAFKKRGFYLGKGPQLCGEVVVADISIAQSWVENIHASPLFETDPREMAHLFPRRLPESHKGTFGHVLVLAGSPEKSGASVLASYAVLRAGAGLVTLAVPESAHAIVKSTLVEVMTESLPDEGGKLDKRSLPKLLQLIKGKKVLVIGPGLLPHPGLRPFLSKVIQSVRIPIVLDADGLNAFGPTLVKEKKYLANTILTPHPGEMGRLTGLSTAKIQADKIGVAQQFAHKIGATVVLKGAYTVIAFPSGETYLNPTGNPAMATAGMGDVLAGVIGGYLAQGLPVHKAAVAGVFHHGLAGDRAALKKGVRGLLASDVIEEFPSLSISSPPTAP